jgi:uncharacterized coiled-coil protein SlyX
MGTFKNEHNVIVLISVNSDFLYQDRCLTHWKFVACIKRGFTALMANKKVSQRLLTLEHRLERQSDTIKNIQENVDNTSKYQDLRQDVLKSQGSLINRWLNVIGIFLSVIMVLSAYGVFVVEDKIKDLDKLVKESESVLGVIKKNKELSDKYTKESLNPESTLTEKIKQEVKESGTELQKLMLKIRKEKDLKIAIDLWKYVIGRFESVNGILILF